MRCDYTHSKQARLAICGACLALSDALIFAQAPDPGPTTMATHQDTRLPALTAPRRIVTLAPTRPGLIADLPVEEGSFVHAGERVFALDARVQKARTAIAEAKASSSHNLDIARTAWDQALYHLDRYRQLESNRAAASTEVTDAMSLARTRELEYHQAEFNLQQEARLWKLELATLDEFSGFAPFDGYVIGKHKEAGEGVNELEPVVTIAQVDPLQVTVDVPLALAGDVHVGQAFIISDDGNESTSRPAVVEIKAPVADAAAQTVRIKLLLANTDLMWVPGAKVFVDFEQPADPASACVISANAATQSASPAANVDSRGTR